MNIQEIAIIRKAIEELKLDENYYAILRRNSERLHLERLSEDYTYYEDGAYYDIYNPDAYNIVLYLIHNNDKMYLGNEQIPLSIGTENKQRTINMIEYWFRGNSSEYVVIHEFNHVHNKSISYYGCGCNQVVLNDIKSKIINKIKTNLNVKNINEIDSCEIEKQYGKTISIYKAKTRKLLKKTPVHEFADKLLVILNDIELNTIAWMNMLYDKNRYWLISENEQDKEEVRKFLSTYGYSKECNDDELYKAILVIFKEYLLWQTCKMYMHNQHNIFNKKNYIANPKCTTHELYDWKKMWDNSKPINIILSICYKDVYENIIIMEKSEYKKFRNNLYKNILKQKQ